MRNLEKFEAILTQFEKPVYNYILRMIGRVEDAEDITQDTFIKIYKNIGKVDGKRPVKPWVFKIATNTAYDFLRKSRGHKELYIIDDLESGFETIANDDAYYNIEDRESAEETAEDVSEALKKIRPIYKSVLLLLYQEELKYEEIAEAMDLPLNTVKTYVMRAKAELKEKLKEKYGDNSQKN